MLDKGSDIAVALATFNGSRYLRNQLESIYRQTLMPSQIVIFDDGSSPDEVIKVKDIIKGFPGITFYSANSVGITSNFERTIRACNSSYIALADQDDIWREDHILHLRNHIGDADLAYGDLTIMLEDGTDTGIRFSDKYATLGLSSKDLGIFSALLHGSGMVWGSAALIRRDLVDKMSFPITSRHHDWWLAILAATRNGIVYTDEVLVSHRIHASNGSAGPTEKSFLSRSLRKLGIDSSSNQIAYARDLKNCLLAVGSISSRLDSRCKQTLAECTKYMSQVVNRTNSIERTAYSLKNRQYLFPRYNVVARFIAALSSS